MERHELESMWNACGTVKYGPISGSVIKRLQIELLQELAVHEVIIGRFPIPELANPHEYLMEHELEVRNIKGLSVHIYKDGKLKDWLLSNEIEPNPLVGFVSVGSLGNKGPIIQAAMRHTLENYVYIVDRRNLAVLIAKDWNLSFEFVYAPPNGYKIGNYQDDHPVVILSNVNEQRILQAFEIKKNISADDLIVITTKRLKLTEQEKARLYSEKIIYLTTLDFISPENKLRWDMIDFGMCSQGNDVFRHSPDYRTIIWQGCKHSLTATQAACMKELYENHENGTSEISQAYVLDCAGSESNRLSDIFSRTPLWKTLIVPGERKGTYRLNIF